MLGKTITNKVEGHNIWLTFIKPFKDLSCPVWKHLHLFPHSLIQLFPLVFHPSVCTDGERFSGGQSMKQQVTGLKSALFSVHCQIRQNRCRNRIPITKLGFSNLLHSVWRLEARCFGSNRSVTWKETIKRAAASSLSPILVLLRHRSLRTPFFLCGIVQSVSQFLKYPILSELSYQKRLLGL